MKRNQLYNYSIQLNMKEDSLFSEPSIGGKLLPVIQTESGIHHSNNFIFIIDCKVTLQSSLFFKKMKKNFRKEKI
jgi:hypothetical protein